MQRSGKELAVSKSEIGDLLKEAVAHHASCAEARWRTENLSLLALFHAWQAGIRFNRIKKLVGHGHWQSWIKNNVGISERTVQLYMKIDNDNPHMRLMKPNLQRVAHLKFDTIRKYCLGLAPAKTQPDHKGDVKFPRLASFLNIANEYSRLKERHISGVELVDFQEAREEMPELYQFLQWLFGDSDLNPWAA